MMDFFRSAPGIIILVGALCCSQVHARIPPPPVPMDDLIAKAELIVIARVKPEPVKKEAGKNPHSSGTLTLIISRVLKGKLDARELTIKHESFPIQWFSRSDEHPNGRLLLTGWDFNGHVVTEERGLELYAEQIWFLERPRKVLRARHFDSVQALRFLPLIELMVGQKSVAEVRALIEKSYEGVIPKMAVQYFRNSTDPRAGQLAWDYLQQADADAHAAYRTINSLPRESSLKWCRRGLTASSPQLRKHAIDGIAIHGDAESIPALCKLFARSEVQHEKENIIRMLGEMEDARAVPFLLDVLTGPDPAEPPDTFLWEEARIALHAIAHVYLSPNGDSARKWWERNKAQPRSEWLKQGIEQDLYLYTRFAPQNWVAEIDPRNHLEDVTCHHFHLPMGTPDGPEQEQEMEEHWVEWWTQNRDQPQEGWLLEAFDKAEVPLRGLKGPALVERLIEILHTETNYESHHGRVLTHIHHRWCHRLLTRLTGLHVRDTSYAFAPGSYIDGAKYGALWRKAWEAHRDKITVKPLKVPTAKAFSFAAEDSSLLCDDFGRWKASVVHQGPLVRKAIPGMVGRYIIGTFEIRLCNRSDRTLRIYTKPQLAGESGQSYGNGGSLSAEEFRCISHKGEFASIGPGETIVWREQQSLHSWDGNDTTWLRFRLLFQQSGPDRKAWRGVVRTPWVSVKKEGVKEK